MTSNSSKLSVLVCAALAALTLATVAEAQSSGSRNPGTRAFVMRVDRALIARHQALARLGESRVYTDPAILARHRALARLGTTVAPRRETGPSGSSSWPRATVEVFAASVSFSWPWASSVPVINTLRVRHEPDLCCTRVPATGTALAAAPEHPVKRIVLLVGLVLGVLAVALPASATQPQKIQIDSILYGVPDRRSRGTQTRSR